MSTLPLIDLHFCEPLITNSDLEGWEEPTRKALEKLLKKTGEGSDYLGWLDLPAKALETVDLLQADSQQFVSDLNTVVVIGIGGSYLGARAVIEALSPHFGRDNNTPEILFAGQNISENYLSQMLTYLQSRQWGIVVISKSGTTTEPAVAFRLLKRALESQVGKANSVSRILAITDARKGALRILADEMGYPSYIIPDDIGGRYSVLTPVGLVPIVMAGLSGKDLLQGAYNVKNGITSGMPLLEHPAALYAIARNILYSKGKQIEILAGFQPSLHFLFEWWKQLFGESEGKNGKGIFPAAVDFTTDLHSMGQYIQEGPRHLFETVIQTGLSEAGLLIPHENNDLDELNYLAGWPVDKVNAMAAQGTMMAHYDGGVPIIQILVETLDAYHLGQLIYIFELACGISGYLLEVNPFNQPGVEAYKNNMFRLLNKPGYRES